MHDASAMIIILNFTGFNVENNSKTIRSISMTEKYSNEVEGNYEN